MNNMMPGNARCASLLILALCAVLLSGTDTAQALCMRAVPIPLLIN